MKKRIIFSIVAIIAVAIIWAVAGNTNKNDVLVEEQELIEQREIPVFYGDNEIPVINNVSKDISFNIELKDGTSADYELVDDDGNPVNERIEKTDTGYTIKAPQEGYKKGQTYHLVLNENNTFSDEEYQQYNAVDFVVNRESKNVSVYSDTVKEDNTVVPLSEQTVDLSKTDYCPGDIIYSDMGDSAKVMKIISVDDNGIAQYTTPSLLEIYDYLDLHESFDVVPEEESLQEFTSVLNNDNELKNLIAGLFFEKVGASDTTISVDFNGFIGEDNKPWGVLITASNTKKGISIKIGLTFETKMNFDAVLVGTQRYIEGKLTTTTKFETTAAISLTEDQLAEIVKHINKNAEKLEFRAPKEPAQIPLYSNGIFKIRLNLSIKGSLSFNGSVELNGSLKTVAVKGFRMKYFEDGTWEMNEISSEPKRYEFGGYIKGTVYVTGSIGFEFDLGIEFIDPKVLTISYILEPKITLKLAAEASLNYSVGSVDDTSFSAALKLYFEAPGKVKVTVMYSEILKKITEKKLADNTNIDINVENEGLFSSLTFQYAFPSLTCLLYSLGNADYINEIKSVDFTALPDGIYVDKLNAETYNYFDQSLLSTKKLYDLQNVEVYIAKKDSEDYTRLWPKDYIEAIAGLAEVEHFYPYDFKENGEYTVKFVYWINQCKSKEYTADITYDGCSFVQLDCGEGEIENGCSVLSYHWAEGLASLPIPVRSGYSFAGWYIKEDNIEKEEILVTEIKPINKEPNIDEEPLTLRAHWEIRNCEVNLVYGGGDQETIYIEPGQKIVTDGIKHEHYTTPKKWYRDKECKNLFDLENTPITGDITLYTDAAPCLYQVRFDTLGYGEISDQFVIYGSRAKKPETPYRKGYTIGKWVDEDNNYFSFNTKIDGDIVLEAVWVKERCLLQFECFGKIVNSMRFNYGESIDLGDYNKNINSYYENAEFMGWYLDKDYKKPFNSDKGITEDTVVYGKFSAVDDYAVITFDAKDGSYIEPIIAKKGSEIILANQKPTRKGYRFLGWCTDAACKKMVTSQYIATDDTVLYAKWELIMHKVEFYSEGSVFTTKSVVDSFLVNRPSSNPVKLGYDFTGWYADSTYTTPFDFNAPITKDTKAYAKYTEKYCTVTIVLYDEKIKRKVVLYGSKLELPENPTRPGYVFKCWMKGYGLNKTEYKNTDFVFGDFEIYAEWINESYTIELNYQFDNKKETIEKLEYDDVINKDHYTIEREGYTFAGWYLDSECSDGKEYDLSSPIRGSATLYAKYVPKEYTITYYDGSNLFATKTIGYNQRPDILKCEKQGYVFKGWRIKNVYGEQLTSNTKVTSDIAVYATWEPIYYKVSVFSNEDHINPIKIVQVKYGDVLAIASIQIKGMNLVNNCVYIDDACKTVYSFEKIFGDTVLYAEYKPITFSVELAIDDATSIDQQTVDYGKPINTSALKTKRVGYDFVGWYKDEQLTQPYNNEPVTSNITLYGKWQKKYYTVSYLVDKTLVDQKRVQEGFSSIYSYSKTGYTFSGWYTDAAYTQQYSSTTAVMGDTILYGYTKKIPDKTIAFVSENSTINTIGYCVGEKYSELPTPESRTGYDFVGWFTAETGGTQITNDTIVQKEHSSLYARWQKKYYTVSFYVDGSLYDIKNFEHGTKANVNYSRDGYRFYGWYTDSRYTDKYPEDAICTSNMILYGYTSQIAKIITFNNEFADSSTGEYYVGSKYGELPTPSSKTGYNFVGWYTAETGGTKITTNTIVKQEHDNLYARWEKKYFTVSYLVDKTLVDQKRVQEGNTTSYNYSKSGYTFSGWFTDAAYKNQYSSSTAVMNDLVLYGFTKKDPDKIITFINEFADSSTGGYYIGEKYGSLPSPTQTGYNFVGWFTAETGGTQITNDTIVQKEHSNLYARWQKKRYTVTFYVDGSVYDIKNYEHGATAIVNYNRDGYRFYGWYTEPEHLYKYPQGITCTSNMNLYGYTEKIMTKSITLVNSLGSNRTITKEIGTTYGDDLAPLSKTGYTFVGWFTAQSGGTQLTQTSTVKDEHSSVYARWQEKYFTVYYYVNGSRVNQKTVQEGYSSIYNYSKSGYTFYGWYTNSNYTNKYSSTTPVMSDINLYGYTVQIPDKTITLVNRFASNTTIQVCTGGTYSNLPTPSKTGYTFKGWYTAASGGERVTNGSAVKSSHSTLYAHWEDKMCTVNFYVDGELVATKTVREGEKVSYSYSRSGHKFFGWYSDSAYKNSFSLDSAITSNMNLYAYLVRMHA